MNHTQSLVAAGKLGGTNQTDALAGKLLLTSRELAARLGVSVRKVESWTATGVVPALRLSPRMVRFELPAVLAALRQYQTATLK